MMKNNWKIKKILEEGGDVSQIPVIPQENDDYVQCEYCSWKFAPLTAERHIPHCKNMVHRPKPPPYLWK